MNQLNFPIISFIILFPLAGVLLLLFIRGDKSKNYGLLRIAAFVISLFEFLVSLVFPIYFNSETPHMQFVEHVTWVKSMGLSYFVGIDGISLWLVVLTTFLVPLCMLCSWTSIQKNVKAFLISMLLLETAMIGAFVSLDLVLFFIFWEFMLIPLFLLMGIGGGSRRIYSAIKFFLYTACGSVFMLVAIIFLHYYNYKIT